MNCAKARLEIGFGQAELFATAGPNEPKMKQSKNSLQFSSLASSEIIEIGNVLLRVCTT